MESITENSTNSRIVPFHFTGKTSEYFKIWIVNGLLTVLTLGIYSAWAKVRTNRYIYGNIYLDNQPFSYTALPANILKGRLLALGFFIVYTLSGQYSNVLNLILTVSLLPIVPWVIVNSLRFRGKYTCYRNIPFIFTGGYADAFKYFMLMYILVPFTLGLIIPYIYYKQKNYIISNYHFGTLPIKYKGTPSTFYIAFIAATMISLIFAGVIVIIVTAMGWSMADYFKKILEQATQIDASVIIIILGIYGLIILSIIVGSAFYKIFILNNVISNIYISKSQLHCEMDYLHYIYIFVTNILAILFSLGLAIPWARIRYIKYFYSSLSIILNDNLDEITSMDEKEVKSFAEELGGFLDLDIGF
ncbi:MAG: YjgN family protein [Spirochaetes bacterium]|nr:YjgN family protein [Spirochaetota bacterium]